MNTFLPTHPARGKFFGFLPGTLALLLCAASAQADFSGAFILTPPPNGSYANSPTLSAFGGWFLTTPGSGDIWQVDTGTAPTNLTLSVLDFVGVNPGPTALVHVGKGFKKSTADATAWAALVFGAVAALALWGALALNGAL